MADEITVTAGIALSNGLLTVKDTKTTRRFTQTTARGGNPGTVDIGTSEETVSFGDCVPGVVEMENLDTTNYVSWGFTTGQLQARLVANGDKAIIRLNTGATLIMQANTAACKVRITAFNQ